MRGQRESHAGHSEPLGPLFSDTVHVLFCPVLASHFKESPWDEVEAERKVQRALSVSLPVSLCIGGHAEQQARSSAGATDQPWLCIDLYVNAGRHS